MLQVEGLEAYYGAIQALGGISLDVNEGEIVCLIGSNGAGKTTLLNCISGVHLNQRGRITFKGVDISRASSQKRVGLGIVQVPESRQLFTPMSVEENLEMGAYLRASRITSSELLKEKERITERFPALSNRLKQRAGTLSGGEQQMVAIGRGLMADPALLLLDEPSLGLAPLLVRGIFRIIQELQQEGRTILLVEQNALGALAISNRAYVLDTGRLTIQGNAAALVEDPRVRRAFLGQDVSA
ncbi:MAG: ABC transporter ATP-binding protein [Deltaproteobacteria bacterium]|nr:ABC transporter ATP-binding protein [Deltaproteobacteria bacterium]